MGVMKKLDKWSKEKSADMRENLKKDKEKMKEDHLKLKKEIANERSAATEQEKLAKTGNFLIRGISFWLLIPFLGVAFIIGLFIVVGILEWIGIM